mgnify:CR=1 FL=1
MCIAVVGKVVEVRGKKGVVEVDGKLRAMDFGIVNAKKCDFVSCALNIAVEKIPKKEAELILSSRTGASGKATS